MLPSQLKKAVIFAYTPLYAISISMWVTNTVLYEEQWICIKCRMDEPPSIKQQFLYFTVWNMWMAVVVFAAWAYPWPCSLEKSLSVAQKVFRVALPHCSTVMLTYIYYVATNPIDEFINTEDCYFKLRSAMAKSIGNESVANVFIGLKNTSDYTVHWLSAPLLWLLLLSEELEYRVLFPYSTVFIAVLGVTVGLAETYTPSGIYCGNTWFNVGMSILINFVIHCLLVMRDWKIKKREDVVLKIEMQEGEANGDDGVTGKEIEVGVE